MMIDESIHMGERLKVFVEEYCSRTGKTKTDVAEKAGITPGALSAIFRSPVGTLASIAKVCIGCDQRAYWFIASIELPKMPAEAFQVLEEIFFLPQKKREFFLRQMIEIKKLMDEIEKEARE